jgi:hypothetical protein
MKEYTPELAQIMARLVLSILHWNLFSSEESPSERWAYGVLLTLPIGIIASEYSARQTRPHSEMK